MHPYHLYLEFTCFCAFWAILHTFSAFSTPCHTYLTFSPHTLSTFSSHFRSYSTFKTLFTYLLNFQHIILPINTNLLISQMLMSWNRFKAVLFVRSFVLPFFRFLWNLGNGFSFKCEWRRRRRRSRHLKRISFLKLKRKLKLFFFLSKTTDFESVPELRSSSVN